MANPTLPFDIITDILSRLPSKTLIRFKSVSKQWYSLINSPNFINLHLTQTLISNNYPNLIVCENSLFSSLISDNYTNPNLYFSELDHPLKYLSETRDCSPEILGSIHGVLCISFNDKSSIFLYNPCTKTHRLIPPFTPSHNTNPLFETSNVVVFGFGFDSVSGDYKVLRMAETGKNGVLVYREASVYSLKNDSWKCVSDQTMVGEFALQCTQGVLVNEVLHFFVVDSKFMYKVKCFNLRNEIFTIFDLPKYDEGFSRGVYANKELGGCLTVMINYQKIDFNMVDHYALARTDLWVMKEYGNTESWCRLFSIRDPSQLEILSHVRPVVYSRDRERVLLELDSSSFGWYSWGSKRFERITVHGWSSVDAASETWTFLDSLVSLGKGKDEFKAKMIPKKNKIKTERDDFLSSGFKLKL